MALQHPRHGSSYTPPGSKTAYKGPNALWNGLNIFDHRALETRDPVCEAQDSLLASEQLRERKAEICDLKGRDAALGWDNTVAINDLNIKYAFSNIDAGECDAQAASGCEELLDRIIDSDCARRGLGGNQLVASTTIDSGCGNATLTIEQVVPKFCKINLWHDFPQSVTIGAKTKLRVNGVFDSNNNPIGGTWGDESAGDIISDDQEILIKADPLPQEVKIVVKGWGGSGIWKYRKHFHFSYDTQTWKDDTGDESVAHCKETLRLSAAEKRNRYKHGYDCFFFC